MALHSKNYLMVKRNYDRHLWSFDQVRSLVGIPRTGITETEFFEITGQEYNPESAEYEEG